MYIYIYIYNMKWKIFPGPTLKTAEGPPSVSKLIKPNNKKYCKMLRGPLHTKKQMNSDYICFFP